MSDTQSTRLTASVPTLARDNFRSEEHPRWCPGCGDYSILAQVQRVLAELDVPRERFVFISGIGCSSRFPYYMETFGFHTIHGRAPAIATGLRLARPDLDVWIATGDGDALSIGGNHFLHLLRRNVNVRILLFNNQIYGLTKGQGSPTSEHGKSIKFQPRMPWVDYPFNPVRLALGANASFVARSIDVDTKHLQAMLHRAHRHHGTAFIEVYQECNVYNEHTFDQFRKPPMRDENVLYLEHGHPMVFGKNQGKGIRLEGFQPRVVSLADGQHSVADLVVHNETEREGTLADIIASFQEREGFPRPVGVIRRVERPCVEDILATQIRDAKARFGEGDLEALLNSGDVWEVKDHTADG
jgi:2-oxoglutarate ferredoxin oxidoreductase subunit beta